jgi:hypothetical protein
MVELKLCHTSKVENRIGDSHFTPLGQCGLEYVWVELPRLGWTWKRIQDGVQMTLEKIVVIGFTSVGRGNAGIIKI